MSVNIEHTVFAAQIAVDLWDEPAVPRGQVQEVAENGDGGQARREGVLLLLAQSLGKEVEQ